MAKMLKSMEWIRVLRLERNVAGAQCALQFIRARCISIYFTYGLWRSAAAPVLTRLCRPPARSYADNFRPTGNELNWKPRKRQASGFVIYQTHSLPDRFSPLSRWEWFNFHRLNYYYYYYYYYYSNHRIRSFDHVVRTLSSLTCLTCISISNLVVYNKFPTRRWRKSECSSSEILSSNGKVRLNYLIGISRSFACSSILDIYFVLPFSRLFHPEMKVFCIELR